ncbi:MAG: GT4 family glycosyltransferase PelF [Planctomycetota bacterium]|jgi:glycosyltransferase involved in cell wall biosynthesis
MKQADVCLVLEGTYPFVSGGVSSWVHRLTSDMPQHTFHILHISPKRDFYPKGPVYEMPENILGVQEVYLHDYVLNARGRPADLRSKVERFRSLVHDMQEGAQGSFANFLEALQSERGEGFSSFDLLQTWESWDVLVESYRKEAGDESFLNFFWTWRYAYLPLFNLLSAPIPPARVYHTISTGYAGMLAAGASIRFGRPMLLTEHGIYAKERRIEINRCDWIQDWDSGELVAERAPPYFRRYWIRQFEMMSRITYEYADEIFTLYTGNTLDQIADGADPEKIRVIPNGIDLERFGNAARVHDARPPNKRFTVCFLGRVCPIKDVITFINAMRLVADKVPDVHCRVLGPMDEDPEYADMCKRQVELLELENNVFFEGKVNVLEELPKVDVMVLTSISEAQPLVILEAGAIGIPSIATDVGSCSELLYGRGPEDRALGAGGLVTAMASPGETARAILELHDSPQLRERMRDSMRARVEKFYDQRDMVSAYDQIYAAYKAVESCARAIPPEPAPIPAPEPAPENELPTDIPVPPDPVGADIHEFPDPGLPLDADPVATATKPGVTDHNAPGSRPQHPDVDPVTSTAESGALLQSTPGSATTSPDVDPVTDSTGSRELRSSTPGSDPQHPDVEPVTESVEPGNLTRTGEIPRDDTETEADE